MKKITRICVGIFAMALIISSSAASSAQAANTRVSADEEFRAVWYCTVLNLDFPSKKGLTTAEMKKEIDNAVNKSYDLGLNAIVFQVRPQADALYKSNIFPWSEYITGIQGLAPKDDFDPLAYIIEKTHEKGMELHAWINPYRVTHTSNKRTNVNSLDANHPARLNPEWVVEYNGALYFDPGLPECKQLILDGVAEIVRNYDVDGIHMDDYFYPASDFSDSETFEKYGNGMRLADWRRENVNDVIKGIQAVIRDINPDVRFGISPSGVWRNQSNDPLGSNTRGHESYSNLYADTRRWVKEGWLDYICPQIYWYIGYSIADYQILLDWWLDVADGTGVDLYIGQAAYREFEKQDKWEGEMTRQLELNRTKDGVKGSIFFRYASLKNGIDTQIKAFYENNPPAPKIVMDKLSVAQPLAEKTSVNTPADEYTKRLIPVVSAYNFFGTCVPGVDLYVNGTLVENRVAEGFFSVYLPLSDGDNVFTFSQEGQEDVVRTVTLKKVTTKPSEPAKIKTVDESSLQYAAISADFAWVYPSNTTGKGANWYLTKGTRDRVIAQTESGSWFKLSSGVWVEKSNVTVTTENSPILNTLSGGQYIQGENADIIKWSSDINTAVNVTYDGSELRISFGMHTTVPDLDVAELADFSGTIFSGIRKGLETEQPYYSFTFDPSVNLEGFYTEYKDGEFTLVIKKRKQLSEGDKPLTGFTFVVDAGHGQNDTGALGPMGKSMAEKDINLINAKKLAERLSLLGAEVIMTRQSDISLTLYQRTEASRAVNPDMFISIHANSVAETTNATNIRGFTVWYRNSNSEPLANRFGQELKDINPATNRSEATHQANLYVCRPPWTPSVIIEASFMCNITDFVWLIDEEQQDRMADGIVSAIKEYYTPKTR